MEKERGTAFGFRKTATAVIKPDRQIDRYVHLLVCYLNKLQNAWCNDKDHYIYNLLMMYIHSYSARQNNSIYITKYTFMRHHSQTQYHLLPRAAPIPIPTMSATIVKPCATTRALIMYCDIRISPFRKLHRPQDRAPNVNKQPAIEMALLSVQLCCTHQMNRDTSVSRMLQTPSHGIVYSLDFVHHLMLKNKHGMVDRVNDSKC